MKIHKEGYSSICIVLVFLAICNYVLGHYTPAFIAIPFGVISLAFFIFIVSFFRLPNRTITPQAGVISAPCDGKIVVIEKTTENEYFKDERMQVSIFMSPLNVHVNWFPISGKIQLSKYHKGKHFVAWHPKSSELNERSTVVVNTDGNKEILFRQIAGAVARRVVCYAKENTDCKQGEETGFIKFGSRVDLFLPLDATIHAQIGDVVVGNTTIIATL